MLDRGPLNDPPEFARRIRAYERKVAAFYHVPVSKVSQDFNFAALVAAHELRQKCRCLAPLSSDECITDAVWGYNGRASWHQGDHRQSPYVWNDPKNGRSMPNRYKKKDGTVVEFLDTRPGVMVIYRELKALRQKGELP